MASSRQTPPVLRESALLPGLSTLAAWYELAVLPPFSPDLVALDLDGTLLEELHGPAPRMLGALQACRKAGIELAFLTGRRPITARMGLEGFCEPAHVATGSGCLIWEYPAWKRLATRGLGAGLARELAEFLAPHTVNLYLDADTDQAGVAHLRRTCTPETEVCRERFGYDPHSVHDLDAVDYARVTQIALPCAEALAQELRDQVRTAFGERVFALAVRWPLVPCTALELFAPDANKGSALAFIAERLGVSQSRTVAIGDDVNDIRMLEWAGHSVAMPQANEETRAAANSALSAPNGSGGVEVLAEYLRQLAALAR